MNKLNKKGFTLVELLAVIIILAIVVGITIPAVLTTTSNAKKKAFQTAANTMADWIDRQYQIYQTGLDSTGVATLDPVFETVCNDTNNQCTNDNLYIITPEFAMAAGQNGKNIHPIPSDNYNYNYYSLTQSATGKKYSRVHIDKNTGRSCVILVATREGDYNTTGSTNKTNIICGGVCQSSDTSRANYCKEGILTTSGGVWQYET